MKNYFCWILWTQNNANVDNSHDFFTLTLTNTFLYIHTSFKFINVKRTIEIHSINFLSINWHVRFTTMTLKVVFTKIYKGQYRLNQNKINFFVNTLFKSFVWSRSNEISILIFESWLFSMGVLSKLSEYKKL